MSNGSTRSGAMMPTVDNHPIRLARLRAGLTQEQLAFDAGVNRSTICQIEEGRTKRINPNILEVLAGLLGEDAEVINARYERWRNAPGAHRLDARARNALQLPVDFLKQYKSFRHWRSDIAPSATALASMLKVNRTQLVKFEDGEIPMPKSVYSALAREFDLSEEYLNALMELDERA